MILREREVVHLSPDVTIDSFCLTLYPEEQHLGKYHYKDYYINLNFESDKIQL